MRQSWFLFFLLLPSWLLCLQSVPLSATIPVVLAESRGAPLVTLEDWQAARDRLSPTRRRAMSQADRKDLLDLLIAERLADREAMRSAAAVEKDNAELRIAFCAVRRQRLLHAWLRHLHREEQKHGGTEEERTARVAARLAEDHASFLAAHPVSSGEGLLAVSGTLDLSDPGFFDQTLYQLAGCEPIRGLDLIAMLNDGQDWDVKLKKPGVPTRILDRLLKEEITLRVAISRGITTQPELVRELAEDERRLRRDAWLKTQLPAVEISTTEIEIVYRNHGQEMVSPGRVLPPLAELADRIRQDLVQRRRRAQRETLLRELQRRYEVVRHPELLPAGK